MSHYTSVYNSNELEIISNQFERLNGTTYLDNAGSSLYAKCQIEAVHDDLLRNIHLNPHTSKRTGDLIDQVRYDVLHAFNTTPDEYSLIFTSGSTAALKLIAETFNFAGTLYRNGTHELETGAGAFGYITDNHTSVLGMREIAKTKQATVFYLSPGEMRSAVNQRRNSYKKTCDLQNGAGLFVYPAESNFNGVKYPLQWIDDIQNGRLNVFVPCDEWYVFLDTATYAATNRINLAEMKPDFLCVSFYKIFGYPTGLGALLVKNSSSHILSEKVYFGGGTVDAIISGGDFHVKRKNIINRFEDGTIPFLSVMAVKHGFDTINRLVPKVINNNAMDTISQHTYMLAKHLYERLKSLRHANNCKAARLYSDTDYSMEDCQGGIVNFNLLRSNGDYIGYAEVAHMAELFNIHLRVGSFCNSGSCQRHLGLSNEEYIQFYEAGHVCSDDNDLVDGRPTGCVRVSFGYMNSVKDVYTLLNMICRCFIDGTPLFKQPIKASDNGDTIDRMVRIAEYRDRDASAMKINGSSERGVKLRSICLYPVKSCGAYECRDRWILGPKGLLYDREWMIVKESGIALTQKDETKMCLIKPSIDSEAGLLILRYPDMNDITVPLSIDMADPEVGAALCRSKVCGDRITGYDCGDRVGEWLSASLNIFGLRLMRQSGEARASKAKKGGAANILALANQAQYLLINRASVRWLAGQVESGEFDDRIENLTQRFRGNLIIESDSEFIENDWKEIVIGDKMFKVEGPCTRCQMVCINQETGHKTTEPLRTISKAFQGKMRFGVYLSYVGAIDNATIVCGDTISYSN